MANTDRGFTLIEVLVAVTILAFAIMSVFTIYTQCTLETRQAKNRTTATNCAQQMMEMICSTPYDIANYHGLTTASVPPTNNPVREDVLRWKSSLNALLTQAVGTISVRDDIEIPYSRVVTVEIRYKNYGRQTISTLSMKIAKNSP